MSLRLIDDKKKKAMVRNVLCRVLSALKFWILRDEEGKGG